MNTMVRTTRVVISVALATVAVACSGDLGRPFAPSATAAPVQEMHTATYDCSVDQAEIPVLECQALLALYANTNGAAWQNSTGWLQSQTPCNWYGIICSAGSVIVLHLSQNNLSGAIPASLDALSNLSDLMLWSNQLTGAIPSSLGSLTKLRLLHLEDNQLTGAIPESLGSLTSLLALFLNANQLTGAIPASLGSLTNLSYLVLSYNQLTGNLPNQLGKLRSLQWLDFSNNQLSGLISLPAANKLGTLESRPNARCHLLGNVNLVLGTDLGYDEADRNHDGFICNLPIP